MGLPAATIAVARAGTAPVPWARRRAMARAGWVSGRSRRGVVAGPPAFGWDAAAAGCLVKPQSIRSVVLSDWLSRR